MEDDELPAHVLDFITDAIAAIEAGNEVPSTDGLSGNELAVAVALLSEVNLLADPLSESSTGDPDTIAVALGLADEPPPETLAKEAVARRLSGQDLSAIHAELAKRGVELEQAQLIDLAAGEVEEMPHSTLRVLAAVLEVSVEYLIRSDIKPWPVSDVTELGAHLPESWRAEVIDGEALVVCPSHRVGVLLADTSKDSRLDSLTVRRTA